MLTKNISDDIVGASNDMVRSLSNDELWSLFRAFPFLAARALAWLRNDGGPLFWSRRGAPRAALIAGGRVDARIRADEAAGGTIGRELSGERGDDLSNAAATRGRRPDSFGDNRRQARLQIDRSRAKRTQGTRRNRAADLAAGTALGGL